MSDHVGKLKKIYLAKGITRCELKRGGCTPDNFLGFAHRHKRRWYYGQEEKLAEFNQTILACNNCHDQIEFNKDLTAQIFQSMRGDE